MLSVTNKPIMLNAIMLSVVASLFVIANLSFGIPVFYEQKLARKIDLKVSLLNKFCAIGFFIETDNLSSVQY